MGAGKFIAALVIGGGLSLAAHIPLGWAARTALPETLTKGLTFGGTVWNGHVSGGRVLGREAPTARFTASFLKLITARDFVDFKSEGGGILWTGTGKMGRVSDMKLTAPVNYAAYFDNRLTGVAGRFTADITEMTFGETCDSADGRVQTDVLTRNRAAWNWAGPVLEGPITCEDGDVIMKLSGQDGTQTIRADVTFSPSGQYRYELAVKTRDRQIGFALPLFGFEQRGGEFVLAEIGNWQELL